MDKPRKTWQINLISKDELGKNFLDKLLQWSITYGRYIIVLTEFLVVVVFLSRFKLDQELTDLHESIDQKRAIVQAVREIENSFKALQNRLSQIKTIQAGIIKPNKFVDFINQNTPLGITLSSLTITDKEVSLTGSAFNERDLIAFVNAWLFSPLFEKISLNNVSTNKIADNIGIQFSLTANIKAGALH